LAFLKDGQHEDLAAELMQHHYDQGYDRSRAARETEVLATLQTDGLEANDIARLAAQVSELLDQF